MRVIPLILAIFTCATQAVAMEVSEKYTPFKKKTSGPWAHFRPYIPEKKEYSFELGTMWEKNDQYWIGGSMGFHIGRCIFSRSYSCQQFTDIIAGVGGREGLTNGTIMSSVRWQFTDLKDNKVELARIMAGAINHRDDDRDRTVFAYGIGYGWTTSVHERMDLKFEARVGYAERVWGQAFIGFSIKMDRWVDYFAKKLEGMGMAGKLLKGTAEITGNVIQTTVETTGKVLKGTVERTGNVLKDGRLTSPDEPENNELPNEKSDLIQSKPPVIGE